MNLFMFCFHFLVDFVVAFPAPLSPYLVQFYHLDARTVAMVVAFLPFVGSLSQPLFALGFRSPSFPSRGLHLTLGALLLPFFLFSFPISFTVFFAVFLILFLADGYFHPVGAALAGTNHGGKGVAAFISGGALGPLFITFWVSHYSLSSLWVLGLLFIPFSISLFLTPKPSYKTPPQNFSWRFFGFLWPVWSLVSIRTFFSAAFHTFVPLLLNERGHPLLSGGMFLSLGVLCGISANMLGSKLHNRFPYWMLNFLSFVGLGSMVFLFTTISHRFFWLLFFFIAADFATFLTMSTNVAEAQRVLPGNRVLASSLSMGFAWSMGHALNFLWAFLFGRDVQFVLQSVGVMAIGTGIALHFLRQKFMLKPLYSEW